MIILFHSIQRLVYFVSLSFPSIPFQMSHLPLSSLTLPQLRKPVIFPYPRPQASSSSSSSSSPKVVVTRERGKNGKLIAALVLPFSLSLYCWFQWIHAHYLFYSIFLIFLIL